MSDIEDLAIIVVDGPEAEIVEVVAEGHIGPPGPPGPPGENGTNGTSGTGAGTINGGFWGGTLQEADIADGLNQSGVLESGPAPEGTKFTYILAQDNSGEIWTRNSTVAGAGGPYWTRETITTPDNLASEVLVRYVSVNTWFTLHVVDTGSGVLTLVREHAVPDDDSTVLLVNNSESQTRFALDNLYSGLPPANAEDCCLGIGLGWPSTIKAVPAGLPAIATTGTAVVTTDHGPWDNGLREIGQAIYDPASDSWIVVWTGTGAANTHIGGYTSSIGAALSTDNGETWVQHPQNPISGWVFDPLAGGGQGSYPQGEDPYIVKTIDGEVWRDSDGRAHIYAESKFLSGQDGINQFKSGVDTLNDWYLANPLIAHNGPNDWDSTFVASPTVIFDSGKLIMLYEGTKSVGSVQYGDIGIAISEDEGDTWTFPVSDPIIPRPTVGWCSEALVPDDVMFIGNTWYLTCHGTDGSAYYCGRYWTKDAPSMWGVDSFQPLDFGEPYSTSETIMCWGNDPTRGVWLHYRNPSPELERINIAPYWSATMPEVLPQDPVDLSSINAHLSALDTDITDITAELTSLDTRLDTAESTITLDGERITSADLAIDKSFLAIGRTAPRTPLDHFSLTTGDVGGTAPVSADPQAIPLTISTPPLPWSMTTGGAVGCVEFNPTPPTVDAKLVGVRVTLSVAADPDMIQILPTILFTGEFPSTIGSLSDWYGQDNAAYLDIASPGAIGDHEVTLLLDTPLGGSSLSSFGLLVGWSLGGSSPSLAGGSTITVPIQPEWIWDSAPLPSASSGSVSGPVSSVDGNVVVFDGTDGALIKDGGTLGTAAFTNIEDYTYVELVDGVVPSAYLPSYVDDVIEVADSSFLPVTGESGKIYVTSDNNLAFRWSGSTYVEISASLAIGETASTAARGDRGKTAYDHSQVTGNPHGTTAAQISGLGNAATKNVGTTAGTVMAGDTVIPTTTGKIVGGGDPAIRVVNTTAETSLLASTVTLPSLAAGEVLNIKAAIRWFNNVGVIRTTTFKIKVGSSTIITLYSGGAGSSTTERIAYLDGYIRANGDNDADAGAVVTLMLMNSQAPSNGTMATAYGNITEAIQTAGLALDITATHAAASTSLWTQIESFSIWKVQV